MRIARITCGRVSRGSIAMVAALKALLPAAMVAKPESWAGRILELPTALPIPAASR